MLNPRAQAIGAYLKTLRKLRGLERSEVAEAAGICARTIANMEDAYGADLRYLQLRHVLDVLNGDIDDLECLLALSIPDTQAAEVLALRRSLNNADSDSHMKPVVVQLAGGYLTETLRTLALYRCPWQIREGNRLYEGIAGTDGCILLINREPFEYHLDWKAIHCSRGSWSTCGIELQRLAEVILDHEFTDSPRTAAGVLARDVLLPLHTSFHWLLSGELLHEWATFWATVQGAPRPEEECERKGVETHFSDS